jgi:hypothetical protein
VIQTWIRVLDRFKTIPLTHRNVGLSKLWACEVAILIKNTSTLFYSPLSSSLFPTTHSLFFYEKLAGTYFSYFWRCMARLTAAIAGLFSSCNKAQMRSVFKGCWGVQTMARDRQCHSCKGRWVVATEVDWVVLWWTFVGIPFLLSYFPFFTFRSAFFWPFQSTSQNKSTC